MMPVAPCLHNISYTSEPSILYECIMSDIYSFKHECIMIVPLLENVYHLVGILRVVKLYNCFHYNVWNGLQVEVNLAPLFDFWKWPLEDATYADMLQYPMQYLPDDIITRDRCVKMVTSFFLSFFSFFFFGLRGGCCFIYRDFVLFGGWGGDCFV